MTNRQALAGASNGEVAIHDTNAISNWSSDVSITIDAATSYATLTYEIWDTGVAKSAGGGGALHLGGLGQTGIGSF
jgi:hypothetical protein